MKNLQDTTLQDSKTLHCISDEEAYSLILNNLQDTFILVDRDLKIITATEQTKIKVRQYYQMEIYPGMSIFQMIAPERTDYLKELYSSILNGGPERNTEVEFHYNGDLVIIKSHFKAAKNHNGEIVGVVITTREVTEEKLAARQLKLAEERWRFALEGAQQGVWDWNMQTGECFYSQGYKKLYGYEDHELLNHIDEWQLLIHPEDKEKMQQAVREHSSSDNPFHESTYRIKAKDGKYKWVMARGMIIEKDGQGKPLRMIGTHTDITEQVMAREKIRNSEQHYRNLFQSNPLPCWIYDQDTLRFLEVNQAAIEHYGFSREEFLNADLYLVHPAHYSEILSHRLYKEKMVSNTSFHKWKHRRKNGEEIFVDLNINSIRYNDSEAKLVVAHDVTNKVEMEIAQKKTEEELRKSNERFQLASTASSDAIYDWDIINNELYWGEGITSLFGYDSKEMTMDKWQENVHADDRDETLSSLENALLNKTKWSYQYRLACRTGEYRYVLERGFIIRDENGKATRMIGSLQDITDLVLKEEEILASNERYEYATLATSDIIWDWDIIKNEVVWSDNFQKILGWQLPPDKIIDIDFCADLFHPEDRERIKNKIYDLIHDPKKNLWQEEFRYLKADGNYCYVTDRGYVLRNKNNEAVRIIGAMQDITERKYYEQLLSLERQIFEMSANLNVTLPQIADTLLKGIESIAPGSYTSVLLLRDQNYIEPLAAPSLPHDFNRALEGIQPAPDAGSFGMAMTRKETVITVDIENDPSWKNLKQKISSLGLRSCWSLPIIQSTGKVMGAFSIFYKQAKSPSGAELDTVERIRNILRVLMEHYWSLEEIKQVNERFDIMMKATHDLVWDWNLETNSIFRDSIGLKNVYGMDANQSINTVNSWLGRIHPEDQDKVDHEITQIIQSTSQDTFDIEYRFRRDDGTYSFVYDRGMLIRNQEGKPVRMIGAAQDITVRKQLEQDLLQNELGRQKAINQATVDTQEQERSEIGKELHDNVNQVLTTTKLYLDLALSHEELKEELIRKSSKNVISVINEIRQLSRSLMDPSIGDLGLIDSINDLIENINLTRKLRVDLDADKNIEAFLDSNHKLTLFRIIQEALNNAIKHAKANTVHISLTKQKDEVEMTIQDDGTGFDPALVKKGAGLKNIQNRVYLINGIQSIISAPGKGCKILISFPTYKNHSYK